MFLFLLKNLACKGLTVCCLEKYHDWLCIKVQQILGYHLKRYILISLETSFYLNLFCWYLIMLQCFIHSFNVNTCLWLVFSYLCSLYFNLLLNISFSSKAWWIIAILYANITAEWRSVVNYLSSWSMWDTCFYNAGVLFKYWLCKLIWSHALFKYWLHKLKSSNMQH